MSPTSTHREKGDFEIRERDFLYGKSHNYLIEEFLGEGSFGKVARCIKLGTKERMAVKIVRKDVSWAGKKEVAMLNKLRKLDQDKSNLVKCTEHFKHKGHVCLVFEMLDVNLYDHMKTRCFKPLHLSEIRLISQQMLVALNSLKTIGLAHADIKPDNIMLVNHHLQPFKLKLIDFGLAGQVSGMCRGTIIQALGYRAPEVILGLTLNEAVDMWALGCVLAFMYLGQHLYPTQCEYEVMRVIVQMQGQPEDHLLNSGVSAKDYFSKDKKSPTGSWRLNTRDEYKRATGSRAKRCKGIFDMFTSLNDMSKTHRGVKDATEHEDTQAFLSLLKQMLHVDPKKRITPSEALGHRFITMKHRDTNTDPHVTSDRLTKTECQLELLSVEFKNIKTSSEEISRIGGSVTRLDDAFLADEDTTNKKPAATAGLDETTAVGPNDRTQATADRTAAGTNDGPPAKAGLDDTNTAGTEKNPRGTNRAAPPASVTYKSHRSNTSSDEGTVGFVDVKTKKKRIQHLFSRMFKCLCCCRVETHHT